MDTEHAGESAPSPLLRAAVWILLLPPRATLAGTRPPSSREEPSPAPTCALWNPTAEAGDTVRLETSLAGGRLEGQVVSIDDTQVTIRDEEGKELSLPWPSVDRMDRRAGLRRGRGVAHSGPRSGSTRSRRRRAQ